MPGFLQRRKERKLQETVDAIERRLNQRGSLEEAARELLESSGNKTFYVGNQQVTGNRDGFSFGVDIHYYGESYIVRQAQALQKAFGKLKLRVHVDGTIKIPPFAQQLGLDFSRDYASNYKRFSEQFVSVRDLEAGAVCTWWAS